MADKIKVLVVYYYNGQDSAYKIDIYTEQMFIEYFTDETYIMCDEPNTREWNAVNTCGIIRSELSRARCVRDLTSPSAAQVKQARELFENHDDDLFKYMNSQDDRNISAGIAHVSLNDKWLILFDVDTFAFRDHRIDVIPYNVDCDQFVRDHYFEKLDKIEEKRERALDWSGKTDYRDVLKDEYIMGNASRPGCGAICDPQRDIDSSLGEGNTVRRAHCITRLNLDNTAIFY